MHIAARNVRRPKKSLFNEPVITLRVSRGHGSFVDPKDVDTAPVEARLGHVFEHRPGCRAAGDGECRGGLAGESIFQKFENIVAAVLRRLLRTRIDVTVETHSKHLRKTGSTPRIDSSSRSRACSVDAGIARRPVTSLIFVTAHEPSSTFPRRR